MKAKYFTEMERGVVRCDLCPRRCEIKGGDYGSCGARRNHGGALVAESYGRVCALALDPIEKKPLRRYRPGSMILSVCSYGCNLRCPFCQNHTISMERPPGREVLPEKLAEESVALSDAGNIGVAFTYNEPLVGWEYVRDCAELLRRQGQAVVLVTNGYVCEGPLEDLLPYVDAMNIDLKAFQPDSYRRLGGGLAEVQRSILLSAARCHVEVTALIVPGMNDGEEEMLALSRWLASVDPGIPLHISRFFPAYRMGGAQPTPVETIRRLAVVAGSYLQYVYHGNC